MLLHILTFITIYIRPKKHTTHLHYNLHIRPKKHTTHSRTLSHLVFFQRAYSSSDIRVRTDIILNEYMCQSNQIFFRSIDNFLRRFCPTSLISPFDRMELFFDQLTRPVFSSVVTFFRHFDTYLLYL